MSLQLYAFVYISKLLGKLWTRVIRKYMDSCMLVIFQCNSYSIRIEIFGNHGYNFRSAIL